MSANVNVHRTEFRRHEKSNGANIRLPETLQRPKLPFAQDLASAMDKHPYVVVGLMITVVGIVMAAIVTVALAVIGGMFSVYGTMNAMKAEQTILIQQVAEYRNDVKVLRTYEASVLARQNYIAGLMTPDDQRRLNEYDRANPIPHPPPTKE